MSKTQGYIKPIFSTTLRIWRRERDQIELAWDGQDILLYRNGKYLRKITDTPTIQIEVWDATETYLGGDNFVSYKSPDYEFLSEDNPFAEEYIYRCVENTNAGESPETNPNKWSRQGKVGTTGENTVFISDVSGLEEQLSERIEYTDLSDEFTVDEDNKQVSLNIDYITLTDFSGKDYIQPANNEVKIGDTIWKDSNETWDDSGEGIFYPNNDPNNESNYGLLYTKKAVDRLLAANPGYTLPSYYNTLDYDTETLTLPKAGYSQLVPQSGNRIYVLFEHSSFSYVWREPIIADNPFSSGKFFALVARQDTGDDTLAFSSINITKSDEYTDDENAAFPVRLVKDI